MAVVDFRRQPRKPLRPLPHNLEAEQALLGAILINNDAFYRVCDFLKAEHFFEPVHAELYGICAALIRAGKSATPVTLKTFIASDADIDGLTGDQYLAHLCAEATTVINAGDYGRVVYDLARRRSLVAIAEQMAATAYELPVDTSPESQIEDCERALFELAETGKYGASFIPFAQAITRAVELATRARERDGGLSGLATGLIDLDNLMGGLQASDVIILAGRPGMGKTALATNIAYNVAERGGAVVGFFSLEMSADIHEGHKCSPVELFEREVGP